jgi:hypothetical protein
MWGMYLASTATWLLIREGDPSKPVPLVWSVCLLGFLLLGSVGFLIVEIRAYGPLRRKVRASRGLVCPECEQSVEGLTFPCPCPECGRQLDAAEMRRIWRARRMTRKTFFSEDHGL